MITWTKSPMGYYIGRITESDASTTQVPAWVVRLAQRLMTCGGTAFCIPPIEEDLAKIMQRGQVWQTPPVPVKRVRGRPSQCHRNAAWHDENAETSLHICTGYALTDDGMWRQHSWLYEERPRKPRIIETTVERTAYFGFILDQAEAAQFCYDNE